MSDLLECPHCKEDIEPNLKDKYGYEALEEGYDIECPYCGKTFYFETSAIDCWNAIKPEEEEEEED